MTVGIKIRRRFQSGSRRAKDRLRHTDDAHVLEQRRVPRIARLMALAIQFEMLIRNNSNIDQAKLAHAGRVSRARLSQLLNFLQLAPDIQEQLLAWMSDHRGRDRLTERRLRSIAATPCWKKQRVQWDKLIATI